MLLEKRIFEGLRPNFWLLWARKIVFKHPDKPVALQECNATGLSC